MRDWKRVLGELALEVEARLEEVEGGVRGRLGRRRPPRVLPYRGYGTEERVLVLGRVVEDPGLPPAEPGDAWWKNLAATLRRLESDEVPGARVRVRLPGGAEHEVVADDEGHLRAWLPAGGGRASEPPGGFWRDVAYELVDGGRLVLGQVQVPSPRARLGVISDMDDTVLRTDATDLLRMARGVLFGNVHTRLPFPGVAALYRALHADGLNPLFYVSSSPWNLHDLLERFLALHGVPAGPLLLRDWGLARGELLPTGHRAHKLEAIEEILRTYPHLPFLLVGDSGQEDPEIYHEVVHRWPARILGVWIRNVTPDPKRSEAIRALADEVAAAGSSLVLADDSLAAARDAVERGWIPAAALAEIRRAATADEAGG